MRMFLYDDLALQRVTYGHKSYMMNKNFDSYPNSTTKISWVAAIVSPISPKLKMLQEGLALMKNTGNIYNLKTCSIHKWVWVGFLPSLKKVSNLPNDNLCKDSMGALRGMVKAHISTITKQTLKYELGVSRI